MSTTPLTDAAVHTTPNAEMRRYPGSDVAVWRSTYETGAAGPVHRVDGEQVVVVVDGVLSVAIDGVVHHAGPGDAVRLHAGVARQLRNEGTEPLVTVTSALPGGRATVDDGDAVVVPWGA